MDKKKNVNKIKSYFHNVFQNFFGFESGIDISNDTQVLYRRNCVIKNIILVANILYTIILFVISIGDSSNWALTILLFPITWLVNHYLKKIIFQNKNDLVKQEIAMYVACFYMFLSATLVYIKLKNQFDSSGNSVSYGEVGYAMLYVSLIVVSLYQDKKALATVCKWVLLLVTILHFTVTYDFMNSDYAHSSISTFISSVVSSDDFKDIMLRTAVLCLFMIVLYINVSISEFLLDERKKELLKRKQVEDDFISVVYEIFNVALNDTYISDNDKVEADLLADMSYKLANYLGLSPKRCDEIKDYSLIYLNSNFDLESIKLIENKDVQFEKLREQTKLGNVIAKRLALRRRIDTIVRGHVQGSAPAEFIDKMKKLNVSEDDQIIGLCDVYLSLRGFRSYKRPYNHQLALEALGEYRQYFDAIIYDRFYNFIDEFKKMYDEFGGKYAK